MRLDMEVARRKECSREYAKNLISQGFIWIDGVKASRPSTHVTSDTNILINEPEIKFVGRGGLKLYEALTVFNIDLNGKICMDVGASTGGFTHCMLNAGAELVFAIDTGTGQLADSLRMNPSVVNMEKTNINDVTVEKLGRLCSFAAVDVSFVSLSKVLPGVLRLISPDGQIVCLIKPQFEAGREYLNKHGIVKDIKVHKRVLTDISSLLNRLELGINGLIPSPIDGGDGNKEYLIYAIRGFKGYTEDELKLKICAICDRR